MPQIIPIKELKNTSEISDLYRKTNESTLKKLEMYQDIAISNNKLILERQMMQN